MAPHNRLVPTDEAASLLGQAYIGGRNEYIQEPVPGHDIYGIDYNKCYMTCMQTEFLSGTLAKHDASNLDRPGFYHIKYEQPTTQYPVLYIKNNHTGQARFCTGEGEGLYWHEEIAVFLQEGGRIIRINYLLGGGAYGQIFKEFLSRIESYKESKVKKTLANALYGKLAMKNYTYPTVLCDD